MQHPTTWLENPKVFPCPKWNLRRWTADLYGKIVLAVLVPITRKSPMNPIRSNLALEAGPAGSQTAPRVNTRAKTA